MDSDKEIAVIEQATTPYQKTTIIKQTDEMPYEYNFQSPTLIIIGRVVQLYAPFKWKENYHKAEAYFKPANRSFKVQPLSIFYKKQKHVSRKETTFMDRTTLLSKHSGTDLDERIPVRIALP